MENYSLMLMTSEEKNRQNGIIPAVWFLFYSQITFQMWDLPIILVLPAAFAHGVVEGRSTGTEQLCTSTHSKDVGGDLT